MLLQMKKSRGKTLNDPRPRFIGLRLWAVIETLWPISEGDASGGRAVEGSETKASSTYFTDGRTAAWHAWVRYLVLGTGRAWGREV